jgi:hypothetical protein
LAFGDNNGDRDFKGALIECAAKLLRIDSRRLLQNGSQAAVWQADS